MISRLRVYSTLLRECTLPPQVVAEMTLEQQIGIYIGLREDKNESGDGATLTFQSVREMQKFMAGAK